MNPLQEAQAQIKGMKKDTAILDAMLKAAHDALDAAHAPCNVSVGVTEMHTLSLVERIAWLDNAHLDHKDTAERFVNHVNNIWNTFFPDDIDGWEYGAQAERCIVEKFNDNVPDAD